MVQIDDLLYSIFFQGTALSSYKYRQYFEKRPCVHDRIVFQVSILRNSACHRCTITHVCRLKNTRWKVKLASAGQNRCWKLGQQNAICGNYLVLFRDCGLAHIFLGIKLFVFQDKKLKLLASVWKRISWNLAKFQLNQTTHRKNENNNCLIELNELNFWWGFTIFYFKQMLKVSAFYLEKQKKFYCIKFRKGHQSF